jgi:hypothetical protein
MLSVYAPTPRPTTRTHVPLSSILGRGKQSQVYGLFRTPRMPPPQYSSPPVTSPDTETDHSLEPSDHDKSYSVQLGSCRTNQFGTATETLNQLNEGLPITTKPRSKTGRSRESDGHQKAALDMAKLDLTAIPTRRSRARTKLPFKPPTTTETQGVVTQIIRKRNMTITKFVPPISLPLQVQGNISIFSKRKKPSNQVNVVDSQVWKRTKSNRLRGLNAGIKCDMETSFQQVREAW